MSDEHHETLEEVARREIERWRSGDESELPEEDRQQEKRGRAWGKIAFAVDPAASEDLEPRIVAWGKDAQGNWYYLGDKPLDLLGVDEPAAATPISRDAVARISVIDEQWFASFEHQREEFHRRYSAAVEAARSAFQTEIDRANAELQDYARRKPVGYRFLMLRNHVRLILLRLYWRIMGQE